jgi:hypothetical protein
VASYFFVASLLCLEWTFHSKCSECLLGSCSCGKRCW